MIFLQLHSGLIKGKRKAQQQLFEQYGKAMYAVCRRYLKAPEEAEEAMMNGFLQVFTHIERASIPSEGALLAWMRRIMVNECLQKIRKAHSFLIMVEEPAAILEKQPIEPEFKLGAKELFLLIEQLPAGYRTIFNLYVVEGYTHKEIGELCSISEGASKSQLSKARKKLAYLITQQNNYYGMGKAR